MLKILTDEREIAAIIKSAMCEAFLELQLPKNTELPIQKEFLNLREASELLHLAPQTIYGMTATGKLPHIKKTRKLIFERDVLVEWMKNGN